MPHFYFHIRDGSWLYVAGPEDARLPNLAAAVTDALASARWILADDVRVGRLKPNRQFEIADETGQILAMVLFQDALESPQEKKWPALS